MFGEYGWFIPQYYVDSYPNSYVPYYLKYNKTIRNQIIKSSINNSDINWINEWYNFRNITKLNNKGYSFDFPNDTVPTVFGSFDSYITAQYSYDLSRNMFDYTGLKLNFATFNSESKLTEMITDLYRKRLPFVANMYRYVNYI